jgi:hypothetical protein
MLYFLSKNRSEVLVGVCHWQEELQLVSCEHEEQRAQLRYPGRLHMSRIARTLLRNQLAQLLLLLSIPVGQKDMKNNKTTTTTLICTVTLWPFPR